MAAIVRLVVVASALVFAVPALAQTGQSATTVKYPTKSVRVIVPYPAGGPTDLIARLVANHLSTSLGQQFYVENVSGASGVVGTAAAAKAPGDGHTILVTTNDLSVAPATTKDLPYDPMKSFAPVSIIASTPQVVVVHPSVPVKDIKELVALIKTDPAKHNYASMGLGFGQLSSVRLFQLGLGLNIVRVPFSGAAPMMTSAIAGHTPIAIIGLPPAAPHVKAGKLRALAVSSQKRSPAFPDVPTLAESGIPNQESELIIGAVVSTGTPKAVIDLLQREIAKAMASPEVKQRLDAIGFTAVASTPEAFAALLKSDAETWPKVMRDANIKIN
ncbi:MAG: tripartite tricarboxylate transporter substrate binding protein [Rhizobiales bacterium]|nr:tripartite tricarboxylate transporter substrate binding protein [Hyphomicrobiales bacterium]